MKWCHSSLGYRPVSDNYKPQKKDKLIAALVIDMADLQVKDDDAT